MSVFDLNGGAGVLDREQSYPGRYILKYIEDYDGNPVYDLVEYDEAAGNVTQAGTLLDADFFNNYFYSVADQSVGVAVIDALAAIVG